MQSTPRRGRPSKHDNSKFYEGKLHQLLVEKLPSEFIQEGRVDTKKLSDATGNARYTVYRWLNSQSLSRVAMQSLLKVSEKTKDTTKRGVLKVEDLAPFVLGV